MRCHLAYSAIAVLCAVLMDGLAQAAAPTISSFAPTSGPIGTKVVVKGTGFTGATLVTVDSVTAAFTLNSATQITATVPATASGAIAVKTAGGTGTSSTAFTVTPGALVSPTLVTPTAPVTVTGSGFDKYSSIDIYFDNTDVALGVSNGSGVVSATLTIPPSATAGAHWITADERATHVATQAAVTISTNWLMEGFNILGHGFNPYEGALTTSKVATLDTLWERPVDPYGNAFAPIEASGNLYAAGQVGDVHAYSSTGALLWIASIGGGAPLAPTAANGLVFFSTAKTIFAFKVNCGVNGATCTPSWTQTIGTSVSAGLTVYNGTLYAPGGDGQVHPLNPATGALGTPFYAETNTDGAITTPVYFGPYDSYFYGVGANLHFSTAGADGYLVTSGQVSPPAVVGDNAYVLDSSGILHEAFGAQWTATLTTNNGTGCYAAPAVAYGYVYAGGCDTLGAYSAESGTPEWIVSAPIVEGVSVADGVVYACMEGGVAAYNASDGTLLWGGPISCGQAPIVANEAVYVADASMTALTPKGVVPGAVARPSVASLQPNLSLSPQRTPENL
jgi:hypothetical protein